MWKKYELGLTKPTMSFTSKLIVWLVIFEWIKLLFFIGTGILSVTIMIQLFIIFVVIVGIIWVIATNTKYIPIIEAWVYLKNFVLNRPQEIHYWVPDSVEDRDDKTKWIYKC